MSGTIYLVTGANRGIGLSLVATILAKHNDAFVYAGVRNLDGASELKDLEKKYPSRVAIVRCESANYENNSTLAMEIENRHGRLDTVIANAAVAYDQGLTLLDTTLDVFEDHYRTNVLGPVALFQSMFNLLKKSHTPRFIAVSSEAGSFVGNVLRLPGVGHSAYGSSKAALNWLTRKIHFENEWLVAFPLTPGAVKTDMFRASLVKDKSGLMQSLFDKANTPQYVAVSMLQIIDNSTREVHGGEFYKWDGQTYEW